MAIAAGTAHRGLSAAISAITECGTAMMLVMLECASEPIRGLDTYEIIDRDYP
jgi:hypothetical protein